MADRISRRAVVPGIAAGAGALAATLVQAPAAAAASRRSYNATAGPCGLWPGHTLKFQFFLPAAQRNADRASSFSSRAADSGRRRPRFP